MDNNIKKIKCPYCGSTKTGEIQYGFPLYSEQRKEQIKSGELNPVEIFLTHYRHDILCVESEFKMKPFKYVTFEYDDKYVRFELEEGTGIFDFPDIHDETKPYMIYTSSGEQISWMEAVFELGKKIDEGEYDSFCGGNVISTAE